MRDQPTAAQIEDKTAAAYLEREMSMSTATQMTLQPITAQETLSAAGAMCVTESVVLDTPVITQTPLKPFPLLNFVIGWGVFLVPGGECR